MEAKNLKGYTAKCGRHGIFFGRRYSDSYPYASEYSSNIHQTYEGLPVSAILVFNKKNSVSFESCDSGMFGCVKEYLLSEESYSIENLHSIVFMSEEDFLSFFEFYDKT